MTNEDEFGRNLPRLLSEREMLRHLLDELQRAMRVRGAGASIQVDARATVLRTALRNWGARARPKGIEGTMGGAVREAERVCLNAGDLVASIPPNRSLAWWTVLMKDSRDAASWL